MGLVRMFKRWILPQLLMGYIFIMSGLIVCCLMLLSCVVWPFSRHLYRKINVYLGYSFWSQMTFLAQWWSNTEVVLYCDPEDYKKHFSNEHVLVLMNHKYDVDWLMTWILSERLGMLGGCKFYGKDSLRYVPLMGWAWYFTESIFLKRQWEHDRQIIKEYIKRVLDYPKNYFSTILLCPEGTRFTEEKLKASQEVCKAKGYPLTKHTLLPRTKGFILSMHGIRGKVSAIYDCTVAFPRDGPAPTLMNVVNGVPLLAHFHCLRIPLEEVPESDEECGAWLRRQFKKKDDLYDCFLKTGKFEGTPIKVPRRPHDLLMWCFWAVVTCVPLFYYGTGVFLAGTLQQQLTVVAVVVLGSVAIRYMIGVSEIKRGSAYGKNGLVANGSQLENGISTSSQENGIPSEATENEDSASQQNTEEEKKEK